MKCTLTLAAALLAPVAAFASPESKDRIREGAAVLAEQKPAEALAAFDAAVKADPRDAEAHFFRGAALNRLGRHSHALEALDQAVRLGGDHPDLAFERGWSLVSLGRWSDALTALEQDEQSGRRRGQTREFMGRAWMNLGEDAKAEEAFREAVGRDPRLAATTEVYLALMAQRQDNQEGAMRHLGNLLREAPDSPTGEVLREQLNRLGAADTGKGRPWKAQLSLGAGKNSNVIALGEGRPLPRGTPRKDAGFVRATFDGRYSWRFGDTALSSGYSFLQTLYDALHDSDLQDHFGYLDLRHTGPGRLSQGLRLSYEQTLLGEETFRHQIALRPSVTLRTADWALTELAYTAALNQYVFPGSAVQNRDGQTHAVYLTEHLNFLAGRLQPRLGAFYSKRDAEGRDFKGDSVGGLLGLKAECPGRITLDLYASFSQDDYEHTNSLAGSSGYAFKRDDDVTALSAQVIRPISNSIDAYIQYTYNKNDSNISFYNYRQSTWSIGSIIKF